MIFKQVFDTKSSTYTYIIASSKGREAVIIDPVIENVTEYINLLKDLDLKLVKVIDTHIHADHVTGASKLKNITKCTTIMGCLLYTSPSPRDRQKSRMPSSA